MAENEKQSQLKSDQKFIKRALALAEKGRGYVSPNPLVGAVVVKDGQIIGEGYHQKFGEAHAEINALNEAGDHAVGATLYCTLEPCTHRGKTGPCVEKIYETGISRVVLGMQDPNPLVNGKGITFLRSKGITVVENVLTEPCKELLAGYSKYIVSGIPLITLKIAQTLDGRIATSTGHSKWITSEESRIVAHQLRMQNDGILVGIGTILMDDPKLMVSLVKGVSPRRIVLDSKLRVPLDANILSNKLPGHTLIITTASASKEKIMRIEEKGAKVQVLPCNERGWVSSEILWKFLAQEGLTSVLVEGGSTVHTECLKSGYTDRIEIFIAPKLLGSGIDAIGDLGIRNINQALNIMDVKIQKLKTDLLISGRFDRF